MPGGGHSSSIDFHPYFSVGATPRNPRRRETRFIGQSSSMSEEICATNISRNFAHYFPTIPSREDVFICAPVRNGRGGYALAPLDLPGRDDPAGPADVYRGAINHKPGGSLKLIYGNRKERG